MCVCACVSVCVSVCACVCVCVCVCALVFSQGGRGNALNGAMRGRVNGVNGVNRSPLSSLNSLANQEPTAAEYATIRKFRKVTIETVTQHISLNFVDLACWCQICRLLILGGDIGKPFRFLQIL